MVLILTAIIYITILCWCWGLALFKILQLITRDQFNIETNFSIICFSGLALIGVAFGFVSLFLPLGDLTAHILLALPAVLFWIALKKDCSLLIKQYIHASKKLTPLIVYLLITCIILILVMGATIIKHPDTLHYHAQCIQWIQDYKAVPGLANLGYHYGLQSSWFILSALFSFKFTGFTSLSFLNCTVICWMILFAGVKINESLKQNFSGSHQIFAGAMWLLLLIMGFWSYTQIRLTVSSASPDFISVLYIWLIFFLILSPDQYKLPDSKLLLLFFLSLFVITIKLSSLPVILLTFYYCRFSLTKRSLTVLRLFACTILVLTPAITRNILTTGYPLFPSAMADFFRADWKIPKEVLLRRLDYITTYARLQDTMFDKNLNIAAATNFTEWMPVWWHNRSVADKVILAGFVLLFSGNLLLLKRTPCRSYRHYFPALIFSLTGVLFWFIQAPDPRFGFGFIITAEGLLVYFLGSYFLQKVTLTRRLLEALLLLFTTTLAFYSLYRVTHFLKIQDITTPAGIVKLPVKTIECHGIKVNIPLDEPGCGDNAIPCVYQNCSEFILRGKKISDGFKPANRDIK